MQNHENKMIEFMSLVKNIARKMMCRLPANVDIDDLISSGCIGLMQAIERYDETKNKNFKTYAEFRIRGAILDELRAEDWAPKAMRQKAKEFQKVCEKIQQKKGSAASVEDIQKEMNLSTKNTEKLMRNVHTLNQMNASSYAQSKHADADTLIEQVASEELSAFDKMCKINLNEEVLSAIHNLSDKEGEVIRLYYFEEMNLKEIGKKLHVSESRVCQLHTKGIVHLKTALHLVEKEAA